VIITSIKTIYLKSVLNKKVELLMDRKQAEWMDQLSCNGYLIYQLL